MRICFYDKMHYARKERFVMNSATIALTSEQKAIIAEKMGLVSDELATANCCCCHRRKQRDLVVEALKHL